MTVSVTVDVDGLAGLACRPGGPWEGRLTSRSEHEFVWCGLERVVSVLARHDALATFYVPGVTIEANPGVFRDLFLAGHEIAHHGYAHLPTATLDAAGEREELERGIEALAGIGVAPGGYRSPGWELTPVTLSLLARLGFVWDSSLMDREHPYRRGALVELPVHWRLDDVPYFAHLADPRDVLAAWTAEADHADGHVTYTVHPELTGRGHRITLLEGLLDHVGPTITHGQAAAAV
ncbi:MAG TPA: polysaccharide deacetylase family protein [Solirubrobacteraceae bacterium]|nr:polysaccharide deacetylase family protein [Solirubrobacteraceae bacterium]